MISKKIHVFPQINLLEQGTPTSIDFINNDNSKFVTSFGSSHHSIYDIETSKEVCRFDYADPSISKKFINRFNNKFGLI